MVKLGIIGCGRWGPNYVRVLNELPEAELIYCCDLDIDKCKNISETYNVKPVLDYHKILNDKAIDGVLIATPATTHYKLIRESLEHNKNVLVEKPFVTCIKDGIEIIKLAKEKNKKVMVGHIFEYNPAVEYLRELVNKNKLGKMYYAYSTRMGLGPIRKDVNAMWDLAIHDITIFQYVFKKNPIGVIAQGEDYLQKGIEDVVFLTLYYPNKVKMNINASWLGPLKIRETTFVGDKKMVVFNDINKSEPIKIFDKGVIKSGNQVCPDFGEFQISIRDGDIIIPKVPIKEPLKEECKHFLDCLINDKQPKTDALEGLLITNILESAQKSLKSNGKYIEIKSLDYKL